MFSADITPEMVKLCRVTKVKVFFLVLVYVSSFDSFEFSAGILEQGLLEMIMFGCRKLAILPIHQISLLWQNKRKRVCIQLAQGDTNHYN